MRYVAAYTKTAATIYHLIAAAAATYGLLALIPAAAGIALGTAVLGREDQKGGEQA